MIVECPGCATPYDLSGYQSGQRLRCRCGQIVLAPAEDARVRVARTLHCANCGGALERGRPDCPYCGAEVDLTDARMSAYCGECLAMSPAGAGYCCECGRPLITRVESPEEADERCPRCEVRMRRRPLGEHRPLECPMCAGLFVDAADLEKMIRDQEERAAAAGGRRPEKAALQGSRVVYLKCPACGTVMNRINYGKSSGVLIDYCGDHGYWLDPGELEKMARWVATGGLAESRAEQLRELKAERRRLAGDGAIVTRGAGAHLDAGDVTTGASAGILLLDLIVGLFDR